jgi:hypothetical protein
MVLLTNTTAAYKARALIAQRIMKRMIILFYHSALAENEAV